MEQRRPGNSRLVYDKARRTIVTVKTPWWRRLIIVLAACVGLQGCGIGAFYCLERDQSKPSTLCDMW